MATALSRECLVVSVQLEESVRLEASVRSISSYDVSSMMNILPSYPFGRGDDTLLLDFAMRQHDEMRGVSTEMSLSACQQNKL